MRRRICVALLALTMVLAGCTGGGGGNPSPNGTPSSGGGGYIMGPGFTAPLQHLHGSLHYR